MNFETVKVFVREGFEQRRYTEAIDKCARHNTPAS